MARAFNPNPHSVNGMGVPVADRPMPTEEQQLRDTLTLLRNSLAMFEDDPNLAAECAQVRAQVRDVERRLGGMQVAANLKACGVSAITPQSFAAWAEAEFDRGVCPECGGNLYEVRGTIYCNQCEREVHAGRCPVCGLDLTEPPHGEAECDALLAYEEAGFYDAQAEIAQARIDYRYSSQ